MSDNRLKVLISGASITGLTLAYWLSRHGIEVTVVEAASTIRPGGQLLDVRGPAIEVAERMGISESIRNRGAKLRGMAVVDAMGSEVFRSENRTLTGGHFDSSDVEILRDDLCDVLYQALDGSLEFMFCNSVEALAQDQAGVDVRFANGLERRFDIVIGADGLHSGVRRVAFGPERAFIHHLGLYVAVFKLPNFLELDRWQIFHQSEEVLGGVVGFERDMPAKAYIVLKSKEPITYDYRDIVAQKHLVAERASVLGWEFPRIIEHMMDSQDFHFDSTSQIHLDDWSRGRIVLVGDAGYSVSPVIGQGTTVAMVGAYVLANEIAAHKDAVLAGISAYQRELRSYILRNQEVSRASNEGSGPLAALESPGEADALTHPDGIVDFGRLVQPFHLKDYALPQH